jgi:hypothetical protein
MDIENSAVCNVSVMVTLSLVVQVVHAHTVRVISTASTRAREMSSAVGTTPSVITSCLVDQDPDDCDLAIYLRD